MPGLEQKKIVLGVSGSIAAYKSVFLLRLLVKAGADVKVIMTKSATMFVSPLTFATLSKHDVLTDIASEEAWNNHVELGLWADLILIAPATAQTIAKMANGLCDNLLTATVLSAKCPIMVSPAMDLDMWHHPSTQRNIEQLITDGVRFIPVGHGELASGLVGDGRLEEPENILEYCKAFFEGENSPLAGKKVLVTLGPTVEKIDAVRYISNHSTGKMGAAIIDALINRGAEVTAICGPIDANIILPPEVNVIPVLSADDMYARSIEVYKKGVDIAIFAAAVADYKVQNTSEQKIKKTDDNLSIELTPNPDIAFELGKIKSTKTIHLGFALETNDGMDNAKSKLSKKNFDLVALNHPGADTGFKADTNKVTLLGKDSKVEDIPKSSKKVIAEYIIRRLESFFQ